MHLGHGILAPFPAKVMVMRHLIIILALLCASCNASLPSIKPYKMDIQQGNVVTSKMMLQLKPGMSKSQVRFVMGTPLIQDSFHPDRWDYFYEMRKAGKLIEKRRVTMDFENDALVRIRGDVIPAGTGQSATEPQPVTPHKARSKKPEKKKSLLDRLQFWKDDEDVSQPQAAPGDLVAPAAVPSPADSAAPSVEAPGAQPPAAEAPSAPAQPEESASPTLESAPAENAPAPSEQANPVGKPVVKPSLMPTKPAPVPEMAPIESPPPAEAAPAAPAKQSPPSPASEPESAAPPAPDSEAATPPAAKTEAAPKAAAKPAAEEDPGQDLPPEDDPGYFERMLEKIGF